MIIHKLLKDAYYLSWIKWPHKPVDEYLLTYRLNLEEYITIKTFKELNDPENEVLEYIDNNEATIKNYFPRINYENY